MLLQNLSVRPALLVASVLLLSQTACAPMAPRSNRISIETVSGGAAVTEADCAVGNGSVAWTVKSPAVVEIGIGDGDLHVVCTKPGYRTSEVLFQSGGGAVSGSSISVGVAGGSGGWHGGGMGFGLGMTQAAGSMPVGNYPSRIVVEMTPLQR